MWAAANAVFNALFEPLFWLVHWLPVGWQVTVLALPAALFALTVYRYSSNQAAIRDAKNKIVAHLLELRLFRDDFRVLLTAEGRVFLSIGRYLAHSLRPMVLMLPLFLLLLVQIESRFAFRGLTRDEQAIVSISVNSDRPVSSLPASLETDAGLRVTTPALRADSRREIYWRVRPLAAGVHTLSLRVDGEQTRRAFSADANRGAMTTIFRANDVRSLMYPREVALPSRGPISALVIDYPRARGEFAGLSSASWLFFGMVMLYAFALRRLFDVSF